ncbi:efflux RND transporter periplasmic adaptor subunit [Macellibacteroides fermentans]|nr:efflux RND transporter periplasmic adaptor subunit [Macellibacteroides fermentans]
MKKRSFVILLLLVLAATSCKQNPTEQENKEYTINGDTVHIKDKSLLDKIKISRVSFEPVVKEVITAGTVQAIPTQFVYIAPPFSGRIVKSHVKLGQNVKANTPLFEITSPDFTSAQKDFYQAQSERELAQKDLRRKQDLIKNGVGSQKELEEAQNVLNIAEKEYENAVSALKVYQTNPGNMVLGQALVIRAPISGNVIETNIVTGQYINSESNPVATVADLSKVWVVAQVKEKDIRFIHEGDEMDIYIPAYQDKTVKGTVFYIDKSVDEETRSIKVLSICNNYEELLKIGMYTTIHFLDKPTDCIVIPEKALLQDEKNSFVFIQKGETEFIKTVIETSGSKDGKAIVTKGLEKNDVIISEGGYYLK